MLSQPSLLHELTQHYLYSELETPLVPYPNCFSRNGIHKCAVQKTSMPAGGKEAEPGGAG